MGRVKKIILKWLPIIFGCHCRPDRSFHYRGWQFPICARCTGELLGIILCCVMYPFIHIPMYACAIALLPLVADGFLQKLTRYESTNIRRLMTGILFGFSLTFLVFSSTAYVFRVGQALGESYIHRSSLTGVAFLFLNGEFVPYFICK